MYVKKVLIIEDSDEIVESISIALRIRWPQVKTLYTDKGEQGIEMVEKEKPDIVILDIGLPDMSGFDVLKQIRLFSQVPVMILTVRKDEADVVKGLEMGADEYVIKPFRQLELLSRIRVLTRRQHLLGEETPIIAGQFHLNPINRTLTYENKTIPLTRTEYIILGYLMNNRNDVVSHSVLAEAIWGTDYPDSSSALKVYIRRLRDKIEPVPSHPRHILTRTGLGYLFSED